MRDRSRTVASLTFVVIGRPSSASARVASRRSRSSLVLGDPANGLGAGGLEDDYLEHLVEQAMLEGRDRLVEFYPGQEVGRKRRRDIRKPAHRVSAHSRADGEHPLVQRDRVVLVGQFPQFLERGVRDPPRHLDAYQIGVGVFDDRIDRPVATVALDLFVVHRDRKSTRLNSSHDQISYAVFCLKKKKKKKIQQYFIKKKKKNHKI